MEQQEKPPRQGGQGGQELKEHERSQVQERRGLRPLVVHAVIRAEGEEELSRPLRSVAFSALAAGLSMGFSLAAQGLLEAGLPATAAWTPLVGALGYTVGFLIVTLGRQQLYTETTLTVVLPVLSRPSLPRLASLLRFWAVVLVANLAGALTFATAAAYTGVFPAPVQEAFLRIGTRAVAHSWWTIFAAGVFAGWLIALVVWMQPVSRTAWIWAIIILTYVVGLAGLAHVIAGGVETLYLVVRGDVAWTSWVGSWMLPTLLGNTLGGVALTAALNHAQAVAGSGVDITHHPLESGETEAGDGRAAGASAAGEQERPAA